jgi:hypothetical protein
VTNEQRETATEWVKEAIRNGQFDLGYAMRNGFPRYIWHLTADGTYWCGFLMNEGAGPNATAQYKGWPIPRTSGMKFLAEWQDPGVSASAELRATFCLLDIDVGGKRVSRFFDERYGRAHDRIAMPAYPVAQGLARAWWSLLAGRSGKIRLRRFRDGFALPDIRFEPDGHFVEITVAPFEYSNPPVTFTRSAEERVAVDDLERDMGEFTDAVVEKLSDYRIRNCWLHDRWSAIQASLEDEEERAFCEAAGALGVDPYLCDEGEARAIEVAAGYFDDEALLEFLASQRGLEPGVALRWLATAEAQLGENAALPAIADIAGKLGLQAARVPLSSPKPWQLGYRLAEECRAFVGLEPGASLRACCRHCRAFWPKGVHGCLR